MNVKDILIDMELLNDQYNFLIQKFQLEVDESYHHGHPMYQYDEDMWDGILNFFETILDRELPLDKPRRIVIE